MDVGIIVDGAGIVVENIVRHRRARGIARTPRCAADHLSATVQSGGGSYSRC